MSWSNVKLIFLREMRDQLRDRRTLFMIAVLPILFYPLLGASFFQIAQFLKKHESRILVVGEASVKEIPGLLHGDTFAAGLIDEDVRVEFVLLDEDPFYIKHRDEFLSPDGPPDELAQAFRTHLRTTMDEKDCDAILYYPPGIAVEIANYADTAAARHKAGDPAPPLPQPESIVAIDSDKKAMAASRLKRVVLEHSSKTKVDAARKLKVDDLVRQSDPLIFAGEDPTKRINASLWSKILPFVLMIWAVTGAFYPAVDLCAGEKERGTLETLLSSPAQRSEIVMGKLFTVTIFSMSTAMLNLLVMFGTGAVVLSQIPDLATMGNVGPPPVAALAWSAILILPVSILVSAVCLALAALAKSTKEGQHYLAPVMLVALPLTLLPMAPQVELNFGFALIPISGIVLVMRSLLEGTFVELWPYAIVVAVVTFFCCWWSVRWAIEQFNSESVMFSAGERWSVGSWMRQLARDRQTTPTVAQALLCGLVILIVRFFLTVAMSGQGIPDSFGKLAQQAFISIVIGVALPALLMTIMLTRSPRRTLLLHRPPRITTIPVAVLLAFAAVPMAFLLLNVMEVLLPFAPGIEEHIKEMGKMMGGAPNLLLGITVFAVLPGIFEELTFRGFMLSGFRHTGHKWRAIVLTSIFFALAHPVFQQQVNAFLLGLLLGYIAVQTGSLIPCITFHLVYNATQYVVSNRLKDHVTEIISTPWQWVPILVSSFVIGGLLCYYLHRLPYRRTREEDLVEAIQRESAKPLPSEVSA